MKVPWDKAIPIDIYQRVVFKGGRPEMPSDAPGDIASIVCACWAGKPEERPTSRETRDKLTARELYNWMYMLLLIVSCLVCTGVAFSTAGTAVPWDCR